MDKYKYTCKYCGIYTTNTECICSRCKDKLILIRKIREILFAIKHGKNTEKQCKNRGSDDVKSRVVVPAVYRNQLKKETRATITQELKDYKARITDFMLAVFMLTAHEAWGIGAKRMATMCDIYADNLNEASDYIDLGINKEILENRLKQTGLWELYDYILNGEEK